MLGKTAGGLYWMFRYLERSETTARLVDAGFRISLTRSESSEDEWASVIATAGSRNDYEALYDDYESASVVDFLLREPKNPSSVINVVQNARDNARLVRTALTREVWEATNEAWMTLKDLLARPVRERDLPEVLAGIRHQSALVRGALHGTMLRNDIYDFSRIGTFIERADSTARILDVKYYVLLPSVSLVGSSLDNVQWETLLRCVSAQKTFRWMYKGDMSPMKIAEFLMLDRRLPRSLAFCFTKISNNLDYLADDLGARHACHDMASELNMRMKNSTIEQIFDDGLHETVSKTIQDIHALGRQIETDYRFYE